MSVEDVVMSPCSLQKYVTMGTMPTMTDAKEIVQQLKPTGDAILQSIQINAIDVETGSESLQKLVTMEI